VRIFWKIVAALLSAAAVAWVIVANYDRAFLFAAAGACAWFLSYRAQLRDKLAQNEADETNTNEEEDL
jgi:hypothetical protein